ncbi:MAG TPA: fibronectin type III domain-containing protein [Bacteroidales bacterium]|nr:fibronectin type III domain-containing protein [Bacteroidales bacterium]
MKRFLLILMSILMSFQFLAKAEVPIGHGITDLSATNSVTVSTFPWTENFDTYSSGTFPTDWYRPVIHNSYPSVVTAYSVSSPASLRFESPSATEPTYAITPQMDVDIHSLMVTFQLKAEYMPYSGSMHVGVMSDPNDTSTFELVQIITPTNSNFIEYEVFFSNTTLTGTGNHIAFKHVTNNSIYYYWLDDVEVDYIPTCPKPTNLNVVSSGTDQLEIGWQENGTATSWIVEHRTLTDTNWIAETASTNPYTIANLDPQTTYMIRVQSNCGTEVSDYSPILYAMTDCVPISTVPWSDYFDTYGTGTTVFPPCWTRNTTYADRPYVTSTNYSAPGSLYFYAGTSGTYNIAATPEFDVSIPINTLQAVFKYRTTYATDTLFVGVMTDPTDATTFEQIAFVTNPSTSTWYEKEVPFNNYTGTGQYIAFKVHYSSTYTYAYLDNLEIDLYSTCVRPTQVQVVSATTDELEIGWTENGTATNWIVEYKKVTESV